MEVRRREVSVGVSEAGVKEDVEVGSARGDGESLSAMTVSSVVVGLAGVWLELI
jgi:hypothetical protein